MRISTLTLVFGSALAVASAGVSVAACSSSTTGGTGNSSSSGGSSGSSSGSSSGAGAPDCGSIPSLHVDDAGTIFCGSFTAADGGPLDCPLGTQCCLGGGIGGSNFAPEECSTFDTPCTNGGGPEAGTNLQPIQIECAQVADCTVNGKTSTACCLQGAKISSVAGCNYPKYSDGTGVVCEGTGGGAVTACAAGEVQVCSSNADCPSATPNCVAGKYKILQLGFCSM